MSNFMTVKSELDSIREQKEKLLLDAGNKVASVMISMNNSGESNVKKIASDLEKLLHGFTDEEKISILLRASAKIIVNL